jgi:hypothetical protein
MPCVAMGGSTSVEAVPASDQPEQGQGSNGNARPFATEPFAIKFAGRSATVTRGHEPNRRLRAIRARQQNVAA